MKNCYKNIEKEGVIKFGWDKRKLAFEIGRNLWDEIKNVDEIIDNLRGISTPTLIIYGDNDDGFGVNKVETLFPAGKTELRIIRGADHVFDNCLHEQELINLTVEWFNKHLK